MEQRCLICDIAGGKVEMTLVRETQDLIVYRSPAGLAPVHLIIAPKRHISSLAAVTAADSEVIAQVFALVPELARQYAIFQCGFRVLANCGPDAGEEEGHLHFHLLGGTRLTDQLA
jgi:histidine triad (HIT) family protein